MAYKNDSYKPNKRSRDLLERAWEHVSSVSYKVTARWLFYCLLQDGFYSKKDDYQKFLALASRVRHNWWGPWQPDTLQDSTRQMIIRGTGERDGETWARSVIDDGLYCELDKWVAQENYIQIWFEANAMVSQFRHCTSYITLVPFGGMPSIPYKYEIAQSLDEAGKNYGFAIKYLVFW